jgi:hypothetical protein
MQPILFLALMVAVTALAWAVHRIVRSKRRSALRQLAAQWQMSYVPCDVFNLAGRIASCLPVPGAAELCVVDLIYGLRGQRRHYVFTAEYTLDGAAGNRRECRAMSVSEAQDATGPCASLDVAPEHLPIVEQYQSLHEPRRGPGTAGASDSV